MQSQVRAVQATGIIGSFVKDGPRRANPKRLNSTDPAKNVIGRVFQQVAAIDALISADLGAAGICAGVLITPKDYVLQGTAAGGTLAPSLTLPNGVEVEVALEGTLYVTVANAGAGNQIGNILFYDVSTGEISSDAPGTETPAGKALLPGGVVANRATTGGSLTEIYINIPG